MTCINCTWYVEETDTLGDYSHAEAVKNKKGFCLLKDFYTMMNFNNKACKDFNSDKLDVLDV